MYRQINKIVLVFFEEKPVFENININCDLSKLKQNVIHLNTIENTIHFFKLFQHTKEDRCNDQERTCHKRVQDL